MEKTTIKNGKFAFTLYLKKETMVALRKIYAVTGKRMSVMIEEAVKAYYKI